MKMTTLTKSLKKVMLDEDRDVDFAGFEPNYFHQILLHTGERSR